MSPMSTAAMNSVARQKAGVASGVLTMSRMVGGTFGVAAIGALVTTVGRDKLDALLPGTPAAARDSLAQGLGAGVVPGDASREVAAAVREAFVSSLSIGLTVGTVVVLASAALAWALVGRDAPPAPPEAPAPTPVEPVPVAETVG
jgi:hypothetical protein